MDALKIYILEEDVFYNRTLQYALWHGNYRNLKTFNTAPDLCRELRFQEADMVIVSQKRALDRDLLSLIVRDFPRAKTVILNTGLKPEQVKEAMVLGAMAVVQKDNMALAKVKVLARKVLRSIRRSEPLAAA